LALNYPPREECHGDDEKLKLGDMTIGLAYETDNKQQAYTCGRGLDTMCKESKKYLAFLLEVDRQTQKMLCPSLQIITKKTLRCNIMRGPQSLSHTDSYKGNTPNLLFIDGNSADKGKGLGHLMYDVFPRFKVSVVELDGKYFIPKHYSGPADEVVLIGERPDKPGYPYYHIFPCSAISRMKPVGNLPFGVIGWLENGDIQVIPEYEGVCTYSSPFTCQTYKWDYIIKEALLPKNRVYKIPRKRQKALKKMNEWMLFYAYIYRHWWVGNNEITRYHVYYRSVRCPTTSSNVLRDAERINYISHKVEEEVRQPKKKRKMN
jgi:hypothetical protein